MLEHVKAGLEDQQRLLGIERVASGSGASDGAPGSATCRRPAKQWQRSGTNAREKLALGAERDVTRIS